MKRLCQLFKISAFVIAFSFANFGSASVAQADDVGPASVPAGITFKQGKIRIGKKLVTVEFADNPARREHGLMDRTTLADDHGMLFEFEGEQTLNFWMMHTLIPLSIGYFDRNKKLIDVQEMQPIVMGETRPKTYPSKHPAMYALEMQKGWFDRNGFKPVRPEPTFSYVSREK